MPPRALTFLAPIRPGEERILADILDAIGNDIRGKRLEDAARQSHIAFPEADRVHFARFAILPDPDRGPERQRLLFSSNFDGSLEEHLEELVRNTPDMDAIWGRCEGYPGVEGFYRFVVDGSIEPAAFYIAFRDETADAIRYRAASREHLGNLLDGATDSPLFAAADPRVPDLAIPVGAPLRWLGVLMRATGNGLLFLLEALWLLLRHGPLNTLLAARQITATLDRIPILRLFNWLTFNRFPPPETPYSELAPQLTNRCEPQAPGDEVTVAASPEQPRREDHVAQNQLTLVTVIDPQGLRRTQAVMALIDLHARRLAPPGSLVGISTIHFVRWLIIDNGKRLLMLSNYDGSWEAYIGEFAETILSGLDAIWGTAVGYPAAGAQDLESFKQFLRCHQVQSNVFYSGYPDETVQSILLDRELEGQVSSLRPKSASRALLQLR